MKKRRFLFIVFFGVSTLLGCNLPSSERQCTSQELAMPAVGSPANGEVVTSLTPDFSWSPGDPGAPDPYAHCFPTGYYVRLYNMHADDDPVNNSQYDPIKVFGAFQVWKPTTPLRPGAEYGWSVSAYISDPPANPAEGQSSYATFVTGPVCQPGALVSPQLKLPADAQPITDNRPGLLWDYPDLCTPEQYRVDLSKDPNFSESPLVALPPMTPTGTPPVVEPSPTIVPIGALYGTGNATRNWQPSNDLDHCVWYYWRVAPRVGTTLGPYSIVYSFLIGGGCADATATSAALTSTPTATSTESTPTSIGPSATPTLVAGFTLSINANCRSGPSQAYDVSTSFLAGQTLKMDGRNEDASWLRTNLGGNSFCWISVVTGKFNGDPGTLPFVEPPPTPVPPTATPDYKSCSDYTTEKLCKKDPMNFGCTWDSPTCYSQ